MSDVIEWLESPEGERWSRRAHRDAPSYLVSVKLDDPSEANYYHEFAYHVWYIPRA